MEAEVNVRVATLDDIPAFLVLQRESPEASQWQADDYAAKLGHGSTLALVVEVEGGEASAVAGFLFAQVAVGEMEILNFAVSRAERRRGVGRTLLGAGLSRAAARGAHRCFLEVRAANLAALLFYQSQGFAELFRRPRYYSDPPDDAIVCARDLPVAGSPA